MDIFQLDAAGHIFISPDIDDWNPIRDYGITAVIDLDGHTDHGVPALLNHMLYIYFPFDDVRSLPDLEKLHAIAQLGASLVRQGHKVLAHCGMGHNRCALVAGLILRYLGMSGAEVVALIRQKRQGALYNKTFAAYLAECAVPHLRGGSSPVLAVPEQLSPGRNDLWTSSPKPLAA